MSEFIAELKGKLELAMPKIHEQVFRYEKAVSSGTQGKNPKPAPQFK